MDMKKHWIGRWIIGVSILHTAFALLVFHSTLNAILQRGVFNVVGTDPMTAAVVWFSLFGAALFICGLVIQQLEKTTSGKLAKSIGWSLLLMSTVGVILMPESGFWLIFPPAIAILLRKH
jgi:hypothetical protein